MNALTIININSVPVRTITDETIIYYGRGKGGGGEDMSILFSTRYQTIQMVNLRKATCQKEGIFISRNGWRHAWHFA